MAADTIEGRPPVARSQLVLDPIGHMTAYKVSSVERDNARYFNGGKVGWRVSATCVRTGEIERWLVGPDYQWHLVELVDGNGGWRPVVPSAAEVADAEDNCPDHNGPNWGSR